MTALVEALRPLVDSRLVPGLVAAVGRGDELDVVVLGDRAVGGRPMAHDALFRIASITKPMVAALALTFVADGTLELDQPVGELLPELAAPVVVRSMTGPVDDTVPAQPADHVAAPADVDERAWLPVRLLGAGRPAPRRAAPAGSAAAAAGSAAGRVDGDPGRDPVAPPARRGLHVQRRVRHPRGARRPGRRRGAARADGGATLRAARDDRHRVRLPRRDRRATHVVLPPRRRRARRAGRS